MNSLRRPHHIRLHDLREFMQKYDSSGKETSEAWAKRISASAKHGNLFFLLEPIAAPFGLTSFGRKEKDDDEIFRVTDLAMVVRLEDNKAMALNASSNNYELRFLEALLKEKAQKAAIDQRKFCFVMAKPASQLVQNKISELEKISHLYSQGGSRKDFMSENSDPTQEPVTAVLSACGLNLQSSDSSKQPLDLGSICHMLFTPEGRQQDANRSELKSKFSPVQPLKQSFTELTAQIDPSIDLESTSEFLLNSWGQSPASEEIVAGNTLFKRLSDELAKKKPQQDEILAAKKADNDPDLTKAVENTSKQTSAQKNAPIPSETAPVKPKVKKELPEEVYQHITQAISGLLEQGDASKLSENVDPSAQWVANQIETHREEIEQKKDIPRQAKLEDQQPVQSVAQEEVVETIEKNMQLSDITSSDSSQLSLPPELESTAPVDFALLDNATNDQSFVFPADSVPSKLDDFQEPKVVMTEMASLMHKLESQVARAAKKLASKTTAIEQQLTTKMTSVLSSVTQESKDTEAQLVVNGDSISKQFESLFETLKAELIEKSASAREQIQAKCTEQQKLIEESEHQHQDALAKALDQNQIQFGQLIEEQEGQLENLFQQEMIKLQEQLNTVNSAIEAIEQNFSEDLSTKLHLFEKRVDEEITVILDGLDNSTHILSKNIVISCQAGLEKLKKTKSEFENDLKYLMNTTDIKLNQQVRRSQIEFFLPRLKEHKQLVETMMQEMEETFADKLLSQSRAQLEGLTSSLASARAQLQGLTDECLNKLDIIGRNQQSGLEELFASAASSLSKNTDELVRMLNQAEQEITDSDALCKKLVETYSLDNDPAVVSLRQNISNKVDGLKAQVKNELESAVNSDCASLEELIRNQHSKLNTKRAELAQRVHFASDQGVQRIRAAIHDTFNAIQSEREKYME